MTRLNEQGGIVTEPLSEKWRHFYCDACPKPATRCTPRTKSPNDPYLFLCADHDGATVGVVADGYARKFDLSDADKLCFLAQLNDWVSEDP